MNFIIFDAGADGVGTIFPTPDSGLTIEEVAAKDAPVGAAWRIVDTLPDDPPERWRWSPNGPLVIAEPTPLPVPDSITFAQLLIGLVSEGWITEADGESWLEGRLPEPVQALIATLPQDQRFSAKARAIRPSTVLRNDPLVGLLAAAHGKTQEQLDAFFITYGAV
jgi:hypothetical protein